MLWLEFMGGNGFLSVYLTGILMGNAKTKNKANVVRFFDNVTILAQIATFFSHWTALLSVSDGFFTSGRPL